MNILCAICSDLVNQAENIYVTKCGHIFHFHCLSQWIERSKSCPQCRNKVTDKCMFRMYPTISSVTGTDDAATLQSSLDDAKLQLRQNKAENKKKDGRLKELEDAIKKNEGVIKSLEQKLVSRTSAVSALTEQVTYLKIENKQTNKLREENEVIRKNLDMLNGLQKVLNATSGEVEQMLKGYTDLRTIATFATALKRALCESESKKNALRDQLQVIRQHNSSEKHRIEDMQNKIIQLQDKLERSEAKYAELKKRKASDMEAGSSKGSHAESAKQPRRSSERATPTQEVSINTMVKRIENADSPYLALRQSSLALALTTVKPTEFASICRKTKSNPLIKPTPLPTKSIFSQKERLSPIPKVHDNNRLDISYDGLGGHSKLDTFPTPNKKPVLKSCVPKLTSKHKLKRPAFNGSQDIGKLFEKLQDDFLGRKVK